MAHQPADFGGLPIRKPSRDRVARREVVQVNAPTAEKGVGADEQQVGSLAHKRFEGASISWRVLALKNSVGSPS
jgi:hypothetical protein